MAAVGQQNKRKEVNLSTLPAAKQSAINAAVRRWNAEFKSNATDENQPLTGDTSVETVHLGPSQEADLVVTDPSYCSPTGNCAILILRPVKNQYRVVLDGIGQSHTVRRTRTNGFGDIELAMHGSATMSTIKVYKFNSSRYLRSSCLNEEFSVIDADGNVQELEKPRITPCG